MKENKAVNVSVDLSPVYKTVLAGGFSGCLGKTLTAPLSRLTILYQVNSDLCRGNSLGATWRTIVKKEGFSSFWKGNMTSIIHRFPYSAINFSAYDLLRKTMYSQYGWEETPAVRLGYGAMSGAMACIMCYPLDIIRTRFVVQPQNVGSEKRIQTSIFGMMRSIVKAEGLKGLFRGLDVSLCVSVPSIAISFMVYGTTKDSLMHVSDDIDWFYDRGTGKLTFLSSVISGSCSGAFSSLLTFPIDVVRRRMQVRGTLEGSSGGPLAELKNIVTQRGLAGLYQGLLPEMLKVIPMVTFTFCSYEFICNFLDDNMTS